MTTPLLSVQDLRVTFQTPTGAVRAVRGINLEVARGEILGVVGESGCGKSATFRALLGLSPASASVDGDVSWNGTPMDTSGGLQPHAAMVYQNPGAALNPVFTIGQQLAMVAGTEDPGRLGELLDQVGLPDPKKALDAYPHEFSGGMRQRAVIAFALAQDPQLLIADEPTTALDVTTQAQILDLIAAIREERNLTVVFVSHDLAVISRIADRVAVLYAGRVAEIGEVDDVLQQPTHPYAAALIRSTPRPAMVGQDLATIPGLVPDGRAEITGCAFADRCDRVIDACRLETPPLRATSTTHAAACIHVEEVA